MATVLSTSASTSSIWQSFEMPEFPACTESAKFDVGVIGGGITGLSVAYLLKKSGKSVCVLERGKIGQADTCHTTANLTYVTDHRFSKLVRTVGKGRSLPDLERGRVGD